MLKMRTTIRKTIIAFSLGLIACAADAAEWKIDPKLQFTAGYNDNIRLRADNEVSSAEATFSPSAIFGVESPTSGISGTAGFDFRRYEADSNLDDNNARLDINSFHTLERTRLGLDLGFIKDTTLDSQLEATGLVLDRVSRRRLSAAPSWTWLFDERTQLRASYSYSDVEYQNAGGSGFVNYTLNSAQLSLTRAVTERAAGSLTLSGTKTDNDNDVQSTNTNLQGGLSYQFSETLSTSLFAGIRRTKVDYSRTSLLPIFSGNTLIGFVPLTQDISSSDYGYVFSASLTKKFLRGETGFSATRDISNDINGTPIEVDRLRWQNLYRFSETLSANLNLELYNSQSNNSVSTSLNRNYYQVEPKFNWRFKQFWTLAASYRYRKQSFDSTSDDAVQNAAYLTLIYRWPRISASR
jgi:hypothetical protein